MRQPDFLKPGDKIGIVAPARKVTKEEIAPCIQLLADCGYVAVEGSHLYGEHHQYSGTEDERASDFQKMINDNSIKAILAARGGYGCLRIIDRLDFTPLIKNPKWIAGFSDSTVFHSHLHKLGIQSLHSIMAFNMMPLKFDQKSFESFCAILSGVKVKYTYIPEAKYQSFLRSGKATGHIIGGNLSILYALSGSQSDLSTDGKILFIEDLDEYLYHIDRMILSLKRSGKLENLAGMIVGGMTEMKDNEIPFGKSAEEIIAEAVSEYSYPVAFGFPAGHQKDNRALLLGAPANLFVNDAISLEYI